MSVGHWTWPYTLIPQTQGEPIPYRYTILKTDAHTHSIKHTHTPLSQTSKHGALLARAAKAGADFSFHKKHSTLTNIQFTHKQEFMGESTTPAYLLTTPLCVAPYVANSLATATWPVTAPPCLA